MQVPAVDATHRFLQGYWGFRQHMQRHVQRVLRERHELEIGDFFLLDHIGRRSLSPSDIASAMELSAPTVSRRLEGLERQGLIRRTPHPDDARRRVLELTSKGRGRWEAAASTIENQAQRLLSALPAGSVETFLDGLEALAEDRNP